MKVIFLDFDGPICSGNHLKNMSYSNSDTSSAKWYSEAIDPTCMEWLNILIKSTEAKVVVSSSWREGKTIQFLQEILDYAGFEGRIIGKTRSGMFERGKQIAEWLEDSVKLYGHELIESFCILDDLKSMEPLTHFLVRVNFDTGLTETEYKQALKLLNAQQGKIILVP